MDEEHLRAEFPLAPDICYLNHAAVSPLPRRAARAVQDFAWSCAHVGARDYPEWLKTEARLRQRCAALLNTTPADIAFTKNTSEALSFIAHGFPWRGGDNVVFPAEEFPSNRIVWETLAARGVAVRPVAVTAVADPEAALLAAADAHTRLISVSTVQYARGLVLDLARLGAACRARGIAFCVDAIQGLGVLAHDVEAMHIDFLAADAHKWLLGPEGIALFYCRPQWRERLGLFEYGWHMTEHPADYDRPDWQPARDARRFECGSPNMLGIHALDASLSLIDQMGVPEIGRRVRARSAWLVERIAARPDLELLTGNEPERYAGIVTFRSRRLAAAELFGRLQAAGVICAARGGGIRFSPHCYTPFEALQHAMECIEP